MHSYLTLLAHVMARGRDRADRTGVGTRGVFGYQWRHDLADGFPLLTTKKVHVKSIIHELLWFLRGETNIRSLQAAGVTIWNEWADADGELGPVYGSQWRKWEAILADSKKFQSAKWHPVNVETKEVGPVESIVVVSGRFAPIDQIANLIRDLKANPFSRRHLVTAWNPPDLPHMKLPPCHTLWQCYVEEERLGEEETGRRGENEASDAKAPALFDAEAANVVRQKLQLLHGKEPESMLTPPSLQISQSPSLRLSLHLYARSIDSFLGLPFNIASYALLTHMLAHVCGYQPGELVISFGDLHIYRNHFEQVREQLTRAPRPLPQFSFARSVPTIDDFRFEDFQFTGYDPHPAIKAPVAV